MENHSDQTAATSRRSFAKSVAAVVAALPFAPALVNAQGSQQPRRQEPKTTPVRVLDDRNEHDTPPPVVVIQGSCIFEVAAAQDSIGNHDDSGNRRKYRIAPKNMNSNIYIAHVKIADGGGEMLFRYDNDAHKKPLGVAVTLSDEREMNISAQGNRLEVELEKAKKLAVKSGDLTSSPSTSQNRRARFRYMDNGGNDDHYIKSLRVFTNNVTLYQLDLSDLKQNGEELKMMIWWGRA
ncbi:MAG TPA: hypothetical protein VF703_00950 [Pyrinomonadaceae bacterium]|jgi:hypothetical protein